MNLSLRETNNLWQNHVFHGQRLGWEMNVGEVEGTLLYAVDKLTEWWDSAVGARLANSL